MALAAGKIADFIADLAPSPAVPALQRMSCSLQTQGIDGLNQDHAQACRMEQCCPGTPPAWLDS
jgi:hypothetical protein